MGKGFVKEHKKKSLLAALAPLFRCRVKYVTIFLLVAAASMPVLFSSDIFGKIIETPPVAAALRVVGLGRFVSATNEGNYREFVKSVIDKAAADSARGSYRNKLTGALKPAPPCESGCSDVSTLTMIKGTANIYNSEVGKAGKRSAADYEGAGTVDLKGEPGSDPRAGLGPYVNRSLISNPANIGDRKAGMYADAMNQADGIIPVPGRAEKVPVKMTGRASGFSWRDVRRKIAAGENSFGGKRPMSQLAETFSADEVAVRSWNSAYEHKASYTGAAYDGNYVKLGGMRTDAIASVPAEGFVKTLDDDQTGQQLAGDCARARSAQGEKISADAKEMDSLAQAGDPPMCYGDIDPWNARVTRQGELCKDFNDNQAILARACQISTSPMDCGIYFKNDKNGGRIISKCDKPNVIIRMLMLFR